MAKGIIRKIDVASKNISREISVHASGGMYAAGLAYEGYAGGYYSALQDVSLLLRGCSPCVRPEYWRDE